MLKAENQNKQIIIKKIDENTINIRIFDNKMLMAIVGEFNSNLNEIESLTNTKLFFRGNSITAKGKKDDIVNVSETFKYLVNKFQITNTIDNGDITYSIKNIVGNLEEKDKIKHKEDIQNNRDHLNSMKGKNSSEWREYATKCMIEIMDNKIKID